jgi:hypothetical protein
MEKVTWTEGVKNGEVLHKVKEERRVVHIAKLYTKKSNWFGHLLRTNCLLKHIIEGKIGGTYK